MRLLLAVIFIFCPLSLALAADIELVDATEGQVKFEWTSIPDSAGYSIYKDNKWLAQSLENRFTDTDNREGTTHIYGVYSYDKNRTYTSLGTLEVNVKGGKRYLETHTRNSKAVDLYWPEISNSVGYSIYRNGTWIAGTEEPMFSDKNVISNRRYEYTVYSYDEDGTYLLEGKETHRFVSNTSRNGKYGAQARQVYKCPANFYQQPKR